MPNKRLLVVEDEPDFRSYLQAVAEQLGFRVATVRGGREFMESYPAFRPEVVVLDLLMPDLDGIEIIRWLCGQDSAAKVLVCSGAGGVCMRAAKALAEVKGQMQVQLLAKPVLRAKLCAALLDGNA